jgi:hypothetical protein
MDIRGSILDFLLDKSNEASAFLPFNLISLEEIQRTVKVKMKKSVEEIILCNAL